MQMSSPEPGASTSRQQQQQQQQHRIICYGDSLTAGTSPPLYELFPYGPHLERALGKLPGNSPPAATTPPPMVRWFGLPGRTAASMVESLDSPDGLRSLLRSVKAKVGSPPSLCIILAGTNDLAYETDAGPIVDALQGLHRASHEEGVPTLAVGVPPSAWQMTNADAAGVASGVSNALRSWCEDGAASGGGMATFVPCPIDRSTLAGEYAKKGGMWSPDGLHLSPEGFQALGEGLVPSVAKVLSAIDEKRAA